MKVRDLIEKLKEYNQDAEVQTVVDNYPQQFTIMYGSSDGCLKHNCDHVSFVIGGTNER